MKYFLVYNNSENNPVIAQIRLNKEPVIGTRILFYDKDPMLDFEEEVTGVKNDCLKNIDYASIYKITKKLIHDNGIIEIRKTKNFREEPNSELERKLIMLKPSNHSS